MVKLPSNLNTSTITNQANTLTKQQTNQVQSGLGKSHTIDNTSVSSNPASLNRTKNQSLQAHQLLQGGAIQQRKVLKNQWINNPTVASNGSLQNSKRSQANLSNSVRKNNLQVKNKNQLLAGKTLNSSKQQSQSQKNTILQHQSSNQQVQLQPQQ